MLSPEELCCFLVLPKFFYFQALVPNANLTPKLYLMIRFSYHANALIVASI